MYIKIYSKSQMELLRSLNPLLKEYQIPTGVVQYADRILRTEKMGRNGFIAILLEPLEDDFTGIKDILNYYPHKLKFRGDIVDVPVEETHTHMTEKREWYMDTIKIKKENSYIYFIYCMTLKALYGADE